MAERYGAAGNSEVWFVTTLTDPTNPSAAELNAGVDLTGFLVDGGLDTPLDGSTIDTGDLRSRYNTTVPGTFGGNPVVLEGYRGRTTDTLWDTLPRDTTGWIVVNRAGIATEATWAAADTADVWQVTVIDRNPAPLARNAADRVTIQCSVDVPPNEGVTVAA